MTVFIQILWMMTHMHSVFCTAYVKKKNESCLSPSWRFPHSHQFCSDNQPLWKWSFNLLFSFLHFILWISPCTHLFLHIYAFISGFWAKGCGPTPVPRKLGECTAFDHHHAVWHFTSFIVIGISIVSSILIKFIPCQEGALRLSCFLVY